MHDLDMNQLIAIIGPIVSILLGGNIWFVRRLVVKVDELNKTVTSSIPVQKNDIKHMAEKIDELESGIKLLSNEIKNFGSLRERIAVIEARIERKRAPRRGE